ncbi:hypothetical protein [Streptomyces telluris]|uniref:Uncharacterized protein n=1 Tax=Streptomyces telluris TaxID=2720021 RepID=A0A9X2RQF6_9ACTN|nr:hypothetical protein [Streptomyces telluris]MCQ8772260.1 hypothetical protein [Streptomyces telluris]NJP75739.1 hypothetical protein [Streptomyces telluris]
MTSPMRQPRWYAEVLQAEEAALDRLYVVPGHERAGLRTESRWQPLMADQHWNMAGVN